LVEHGVSAAFADQIARLPAVAVRIVPFLGSPIQHLLGGQLSQLPQDQAKFLTGRSFIPNPISGPFSQGLSIAFAFAIPLCVIGAIVSLLTAGAGRGGRGSGDRRCGTGRRGR
jgi:hypothetical protein